jgi:hypothetical protein
MRNRRSGLAIACLRAARRGRGMADAWPLWPSCLLVVSTDPTAVRCCWRLLAAADAMRPVSVYGHACAARDDTCYAAPEPVGAVRYSPHVTCTGGLPAPLPVLWAPQPVSAAAALLLRVTSSDGDRPLLRDHQQPHQPRLARSLISHHHVQEATGPRQTTRGVPPRSAGGVFVPG